jgi:hypothetical protein
MLCLVFCSSLSSAITLGWVSRGAPSYTAPCELMIRIVFTAALDVVYLWWPVFFAPHDINMNPSVPFSITTSHITGDTQLSNLVTLVA